jgi:ech hydrogenase subunit A
MLISKWATLTAFVDSGNIILILIICFGSAATCFYWTKWMGKLSATMAGRENLQKNIHKEETFVHVTLTTLTILVCLCFPFISSTLVVPYLVSAFGAVDALALSANNMIIMCIMIAVIVLLFVFFFGRTNKKIVPLYMAGVNEGDNLTFVNAFQAPQAVGLKNWYMESYFGEVKMNVIGCVATAIIEVACIVVIAAMSLGGIA